MASIEATSGDKRQAVGLNLPGAFGQKVAGFYKPSVTMYRGSRQRVVARMLEAHPESENALLLFKGGVVS